MNKNQNLIDESKNPIKCKSLRSVTTQSSPIRFNIAQRMIRPGSRRKESKSNNASME